MTMSEAIQSAFAHYADFSGRARRSEYWYFALFTFVVNVILNTGHNLLGGGFGETDIFTVTSSLFSLVTLVPHLALIWRRLHDIGRSGGCYFLIFIPLVGIILLLVWFCTDSQIGDNQYGPNPKGIRAVYTETYTAEERDQRPPWEY